MEKDEKYIDEKVRSLIREAEMRYRGRGIGNVVSKMLEKDFEKRFDFVGLEGFLENSEFYGEKVKIKEKKEKTLMFVFKIERRKSTFFR